MCLLSVCRSKSDGGLQRDTSIKQAQIRGALKLKGTSFADRIYTYMTNNGSTKVDKEALDNLAARLHQGSPKKQLDTLCTIFDTECRGYLRASDLRALLQACESECHLDLTDEALDELTASVLGEACGYRGATTITYDQLGEVLGRRPGIIEGLTRQAASALVQSDSATSDDNSSAHSTAALDGATRSGGNGCSKWRQAEYWRNYAGSVIFLVLYILLNVALGSYAAHRYWTTGTACLIIARAAGMCLNMNCSFIVLTMQRQLLSLLRQTRISLYIPLDYHYRFHMIMAAVIVLLSTLHASAHVVNYALLVNEPGHNHTLWECLFTLQSNIHWFYGGACLTGWTLVLVLIVITLSSLPCVRRSGKFEVFYFCHMLIVVFWILLILHAPAFWMWFTLPGLMYLVGVVSRSRLYTRWRYGVTSIVEVVLLPSDVTHLVIARPPNFKFRAGDYIYVCIPSIAQHEWHPFTISSAPENEDVIWLHVRAVGKWTKVLHNLCDEEMEKVRIADHRPRGKSLTSLDVAALHAVQQKHATDGAVAAAAPHETKAGVSNPALDCSEEVEERHANDVIIDVSDEDEKPRRYDEAKVKFSSDEDVDVCNLERSTKRNSQTMDHVQKPKSTRRLSIKPDQHFQIYLDGPYGASSSDILLAEHAVLIGAGIGVTPFASILQSLWFRYREAKHQCPNCGHNWTPALPRSMRKLKHVDFFWINRSQRAFEWFVNLLSQLELEQSELGGTMEDFLRLHMYMTSAPAGDDFRTLLLQMALEMSHKQENRDQLTGLKTRTHSGRPDWDQIFNNLSKEKKGRVTIFYCGPPALGSILKMHCAKHNFAYRHEIF